MEIVVLFKTSHTAQGEGVDPGVETKLEKNSLRTHFHYFLAARVSEV